VLSHIADTQGIKKSYAFGAQSFLSKPITQFELRELVTAFPTHWLLAAGSTLSRTPKYASLFAA